MKTTAIVQARMGSSRLPGKVLMDLAGRPVLDWVIERLGLAGTLDDVVVAIPLDPKDDPLEELCERRGWNCFRGDEHDVLDRYYRAARERGSDVVVRVTSDCPLIDPEVLDRVVRTLASHEGADYATNTLDPRTFPRGLDVEAFTFAALEKAWREDGDPAWREHVTPYIRMHPDRFVLVPVQNEEDLSHMRWTVDTPEDLAFLRELAARGPSWYAGWRTFVDVLDREPELLEINRDIVQKTLH